VITSTQRLSFLERQNGANVRIEGLRVREVRSCQMQWKKLKVWEKAHHYPSIPENSLKRILITGGCGFIGLNLIDFLIKRRFPRIRVLDNLSVGKKEDLETLIPESLSLNPSIPNYELMIGDIRDRDTCMEATEGIDAVIHLAAHAGVIPSIENPYYDFDVNVFGTLNLLHAAVKNKVDKFIFASSNAPLGEREPPMHEYMAPSPRSPYGASKLACEAYCSAFYGSYGLKTISLRFSNVYGPYSLHKDSVIAKFIKDGLIKGVLTIYGDGTQTRDFIHVDDLCNAIYKILTFNDYSVNSINQTNSINQMNSINHLWGEVFHLGTGKETSIINLANYVRELSGNDIKIVFEPERKGEIKRNYPDISKAKAIFGFKPQIDLKDGVREVYEWVMNKSIDEIKYVQALSGSE
jgi:UDP-glucose 4-epimerase